MGEVIEHHEHVECAKASVIYDPTNKYNVDTWNLIVSSDAFHGDREHLCGWYERGNKSSQRHQLPDWICDWICEITGIICQDMLMNNINNELSGSWASVLTY